jgi:catechol 2,3-dioxygenase-like lactoylglutathione lyase family enzyme
VVVPVSDTDEAKRFYQRLGWRLDRDFATGDSFRVVQLTPTGSRATIIFGVGLTCAVPGSIDGLVLSVGDVDASTGELISPLLSDPDGNTWLLQDVRTKLPER